MKVGVSTLPVFHQGLLDGISELVQMGFKTIEIMCEAPQAYPDDLLSGEMLKDLRRMASCSGIEFLLHAPLADVNPMSPNRGIRLEAERQFIQTLKVARELSCRRIVFHIGGKPYMGLFDAEKAYKDAVVVLEKVLEAAKKLGVEILLENDPVKPGLGAITLEDCNRLISPFKGEIGFLLDVGHANMLGPEGNAQFISSMAGLIKGVHASDNNRQRDEHLGLGKGGLDLVQVIRMLDEKSFKGEVIIEVKNKEDIISSKEILEKTIENICASTRE